MEFAFFHFDASSKYFYPSCFYKIYVIFSRPITGSPARLSCVKPDMCNIQFMHYLHLSNYRLERVAWTTWLRLAMHQYCQVLPWIADGAPANG